MANLPVPVDATEIALTQTAQQICDLIVAGYRLPEIGKRLGLERKEVRRHLVEVNRRVLENGLLKRDHLRAQIFTDYDHWLEELEEAWTESKPDSASAAADAEAGNRKNYPAGDARYVTLALDILKQKRQMLGLDAPKKVEVPTLPQPGEQGEDYVMQLHERFVTIQRNMKKNVPDTPEPPKPTPVEQAPATEENVDENPVVPADTGPAADDAGSGADAGIAG